MQKATLIIRKFINPDIKAGDKVMIVDGSAFTPLNFIEENYYIVDAYPKITGSEKIIKDIEGEVIFTNLTDNVTSGVDSVYLQDCIIQLGNGLFRTASQFLKKV